MPKKSPAGKEQNLKSFIDALQFVSLIHKNDGNLNKTHCRIENGMIYSYSEGVSIGIPIKEDLNACPHVIKFLSALKKCKEKVSITQLDSGRLSIKSGKFRAFVDCAPSDTLVLVEPDQNIAIVTPVIVTALSAVMPLLDDNPPTGRSYLGGALLKKGSVIGTNGKALLEYWHGIDLPPGIIIPKSSINIIIRCSKELIGFGFSDTSATFHYDDGSFIKTQLYENNYPSTDSLFNSVGEKTNISEEFFESVSAIKDFSEEGKIYFKKDGVYTSKNDNDGACYEVEGVLKEGCFNYKYLESVKEYFKEISLSPDGVKLIFFGGPCRGIIMGIRE